MKWTDQELDFFDKYQQEIEEKKFYLVYTKMAPAISSWIKFIQGVISLGENPFEPGQKVIPTYYLTQITGLANLDIPEGVLEIQSYAFSDSTLKGFTLPKSIRILQPQAFSGLYLYGIDYQGTKRDWTKIVKNSCFDGAGLPPNFKIKCLDGELGKDGRHLL